METTFDLEQKSAQEAARKRRGRYGSGSDARVPDGIALRVHVRGEERSREYGSVAGRVFFHATPGYFHVVDPAGAGIVQSTERGLLGRVEISAAGLVAEDHVDVTNVPDVVLKNDEREVCKCRRCGAEGFVVDEFASPHTGLCARCSRPEEPFEKVLPPLSERMRSSMGAANYWAAEVAELERERDRMRASLLALRAEYENHMRLNAGGGGEPADVARRLTYRWSLTEIERGLGELG